MGNDTQDVFLELPIAVKLLASITQSVALLRVNNSKITIEGTNEQFVQTAGLTALDINGVDLKEFYKTSDSCAQILRSIFSSAEKKNSTEERVSLNLDNISAQSFSFCVKNQFLYSKDDSVFVLHTLSAVQEADGLKLNNLPIAKRNSALQEAEKNLSAEILLRSEKRFRALVHDGSDMIAILDDKANYTYVSNSVRFVLDFEPEIFIGSNAFDFIHPDDIEIANSEFSNAAGKRKFSLSPFRFRHNNGNWRWVQTVITDLRQTPAVNGFVANSRDVTDLIEARMALERSNERYRFVGRATSDAVWDCDLVNGTMFWGEGFLKLFGYTDETLNSDLQTWESRIHSMDIQRVKQQLDSFLCSSGTNWSDDYRFLKSDGTFAYVSDKAFVIRDESGAPLRLIGAMQDITLKKQEDIRLRIMESVVTNTIDAVLVAEVVHGADFFTKVMFVNAAFEEMTGYTLQEIEGTSPWFLQGIDSDPLELGKLVDCIRNNRSYKGAIVNYRKDGTAIWVNYSVTPVADQKGEYTHWIAILRDITKEKQQEQQAMLLSRITEIFNEDPGLKSSAREVLCEIADFGDFAFANLWLLEEVRDNLELIAECFGPGFIKPIIGRQFSQSLLQQYVGQIKSGAKNAVWSVKSPDGENKKYIKDLFGLPLFHHDKFIGALILGSSNEDKVAAKALPESLGKHLGTELHRKKLEQELDQIFRVAPDVIAITDYQGNFRKLNPAASKILGYSMEELLSRPAIDFLHPLEREQTLEQLDKLKGSEDCYYIEARYLTSCGRSKWLAWTSQPIEKDQLIYSVAKDITEKKEMEELLFRSNSLARIGSWEITIPEKRIHWSEITREILKVGADFEPQEENPLGVFYPKEAIDKMDTRMQDCIHFGIPWDEVLQVTTISGELKWIRNIGSSEMVNGQCIRLFGSLQDIDTQKRTEISEMRVKADLKASEKRYSELFHLSPLPMWVYDFETLKFLDVNETALSTYGFSRSEFLKMSIMDIRPKSEIDKVQNVINETRKSGKSIYQGSFIHQKKNGQLMHVDLKSNTIIFKGKKAKLIVVNDISERIEYFHAIEKRNERLREIAWIQSHKVRAPLAKLMGLVNMLSSKTFEDAGVTKILDYIDSSANELDSIIREVTSKSEDVDRLMTNGKENFDN
ncbi:hypothetical protein GCM10022246_07350 [Pedobacter ginsengiterrae]|uniref:histidine kinase n=1 Tax=Pedobacter ginsengiterrae TaxID=871696 RepID=A0ABP7NX05_9SPHI